MKKMIASAVVALSALAVGIGVVTLARYSTRAGHVARPDAARTVSPDTADRLRLTLFLHPQCPCSRATLHELEALVPELPANTALEIFFYRPSNEPHSWVETDLWRRAAQIPTARLADIDEAGLRKFGASTSGQVLMFDREELVFSGGITKMRGHEGDNAGSQMIVRHLRGEATGFSEAPVFGCILIDDK